MDPVSLCNVKAGVWCVMCASNRLGPFFMDPVSLCNVKAGVWCVMCASNRLGPFLWTRCHYVMLRLVCGVLCVQVIDWDLFFMDPVSLCTVKVGMWCVMCASN
jgi:hypothetical protein